MGLYCTLFLLCERLESKVVSENPLRPIPKLELALSSLSGDEDDEEDRDMVGALRKDLSNVLWPLASLARALFGVAGVAGVARQNIERRPCIFPRTNFIGLETDGIHVS